MGAVDFILGNVEEGIKNTALSEEFGHCNVYEKSECRDCFAKFYCSGGCAANSWHHTGSLTGNYRIGCELQRKRVECAIMIQAALAEEE